MPTAAINVEFMDTKRIDPNASRLAYLKTLYVKKYKDKHFDVIISTDTDAFNFLLNNSDEIFPEMFSRHVVLFLHLCPGSQHFTHRPGLSNAASLMLRHLAIKDLRNGVYPANFGLQEWLQDLYHPLASLFGSAVYREVSIDVRPQEPGPDRALVICFISPARVSSYLPA